MHLSTSRRKDRGFTLVELLIVIVILGVLATITVFAVRGIVDKGGESACAADWRNMEHAQEANMALKGVYATETELLNNELLHAESGNVDVTLTTDNYALTYVGDCVGQTPPGNNPAGTGPAVTGPVGPSGPPATIAGLTVDATWGTGSTYVIAVAFGPLASTLLQDLYINLNSAYVESSNVTVLFVDEGGAGGVTSEQLDALDAQPYTVMWAMAQGPGDVIVPGGAYSGSAPFALQVTLSHNVWVVWGWIDGIIALDSQFDLIET